jgi:hypothetical protein
MKHPIIKIILAGLWITVSEFIRNEVLFKSYWINRFNALGLQFNTTPLNGMMWILWSFIMAFVIYRLLQRLCFWEVFGLSWLSAFLMMWIVIFNLQVLPVKLLISAVPLSMLEILVAEFILKKSVAPTLAGK